MSKYIPHVSVPQLPPAALKTRTDRIIERVADISAFGTLACVALLAWAILYPPTTSRSAPLSAISDTQ